MFWQKLNVKILSFLSKKVTKFDYCKNGGFGLPFEMAEEANTLTLGLKQINLSGSVAKGVKCTVKAIMKGKARLVLLAEDCQNKDYINLITGLCKKYSVKLQTVPQKEELGKALGLTNLKSDGLVRRQMSCGACAILKYGSVETEAVTNFRQQFDLTE